LKENCLMIKKELTKIYYDNKTRSTNFSKIKKLAFSKFAANLRQQIEQYLR